MIRTGDIHTLSDFSRDAAAHLDRLAETGGVEILTVDGRAKGVVMSPDAFDALLGRVDEAETTASIRRGLADRAAGRTRPAKQAIERLAAELGLDIGRPQP